MSLHTFVGWLSNSFSTFFFSVSLRRSSGWFWTGHQAADTPEAHSSSSFCARDPDAALNAGHCRLLTKLGERGVLCVRLKAVHAIKNSLPSCQCIAIKNSWAGLLPAFSHVKVDSLFVPLSCHNSPFTAAFCWLHCASAIMEAKSAS